MSDNMKLSQAEIDALLNGTSATPPAAPPVQGLSDNEADTLGEIGNISFGSAATSLSTLLQHRVDITTPTVNVIGPAEVQSNFPQPYVMVAVEFTEGIQGSNALAIKTDDAKTIADLMLGGDGTNITGELNELHLSAVAEAMNQMMGGAATSMSQMFGRPINISPPTVKVIDYANEQAVDLDFHDELVNVQFRLKVGNLIDSQIMQLLPLTFAKDMVNILSIGPVADTSKVVTQPTSPPVAHQASRQTSPSSSQKTSPIAATDPIPQVQAEVAASGSTWDEPKVEVKRPEFVDFGTVSDATTTPRNLALLFDVPLSVTVELGRARKVIRDILELSPGSILELDKLAGEPVDILVNNKRIAIGEVVVIDENFGVRVTDIISPEQRVHRLSQ